ncbi:increased DNA methylation 3 [Forsythia ovata]|uniref:Increased DNA methylation 3 n=1 Tax=Forsythia ovata TaxID=205694 RepID=A0ABD1XB66_9LAMI
MPLKSELCLSNNRWVLIYEIFTYELVHTVGLCACAGLFPRGSSLSSSRSKISGTKLDADDLEKDFSKCQDLEEKSNDSDSLQVSAFPDASNLDKPYMMPLLPIPNTERYYLNAPLILIGAAYKGGTGPPIRVVDISVSKSAYYFCIDLLGVKKDPGNSSSVFLSCPQTRSKYFRFISPCTID